jgi:hypothetical protein
LLVENATAFDNADFHAAGPDMPSAGLAGPVGRTDIPAVA